MSEQYYAIIFSRSMKKNIIRNFHKFSTNVDKLKQICIEELKLIRGQTADTRVFENYDPKTNLSLKSSYFGNADEIQYSIEIGKVICYN